MKVERNFMKNFTVTINAYDHYSKFEVLSKDNAVSLEQAIVDKLGENVIKWEYIGAKVFASDKYRITYEEVIDDTRPIQTKKVLGVEVGTRASL
jgi:hypothetical protein